MDMLRISTLSLAVLLVQGCSSGQPPEAPPPARTVFDPMTQQLDRARDVQKTVDQNADKTRAAAESQERGDGSP
jgi:hypothetical protein